MGLRLDWLGTPALSWRDLWVIVQQSPPGSAIQRAALPDYVPADIELARLQLLWTIRLEIVSRHIAAANGVDTDKIKLPEVWEDLFGPIKPEMTEEAVLADMARIDAILARRHGTG